MADISQIEVNGTTYNIVDAAMKDYISELIEYYRLTSSNIDYSKLNHSVVILNNDVSFITAAENQPNYIFRIEKNTKNIIVKEYYPDTGALKTKGYIPITKDATKNCVKSITSGLVTASSGWAISVQKLCLWGQIAHFIMQASSNADIVVSTSGDITNQTIGVMTAAYRPAVSMALRSKGDTGINQAWGSIGTNGNIICSAVDGTGTKRTWSKNTAVQLGGTWICQMTNNF